MSAPMGCGDATVPAKPDPAPPAAAPVEHGPWRFRPTLEQHLPTGSISEPVLELSLPRKRTVILLAAVLRKDDPHVGLERWTFEQTPGEETLRLVEGGERLLRLQPGARHPELGDLRRNLAAPRAVMTRPIGLPGDDPGAVIQQVIDALAIMRNPTGDARARVLAAATVMRGLDDTVALERDAIWELGPLLDPPPRSIDIKALSERRAQATLRFDGRTATMELQRKADGWAIASFEAPPEPEPAASTTASGSGTSAVIDL